MSGSTRPIAGWSALAGKAVAGLIGIPLACLLVAALHLVIGTVLLAGYAVCLALGAVTVISMAWGLFSLLVGWFVLHDRHALNAAAACFLWAVVAYASIMLLAWLGQTAGEALDRVLHWLGGGRKRRLLISEIPIVPDARFEE